MEFQKVLVTPEIAKGYLSKNKNNRRFKNPTVSRYSDDMQNGRWKENTGELIKISKNGNVLDGQHRLLAVVQSNTSIYFHFAFDVSEDVFDVLDTGSLRSSIDGFYIKGIKNATSLPSIISLHYNLLNGGKSKDAQKNNKLTNSEVLSKYYENTFLWDSVARKTMAWYQSFAKILTPSIIGGIYSLARNVDEVKADSFMDELCTGADISNNVVNILRNTLMKDKISLRKMPMPLKLALIIKCWNFYKEDITPKILKWDSSSEKFPQIN